jgi:tetratricopeptide (TPR) repeat protein
MHWTWLIGLLVAAFTLGITVEPAFRQRSQHKAQPQSMLAALMGDSRRLFANHFFIKSDAYLHSGYYPSIFDDHGEFPHAAAQQAGAQPSQARHDYEEPGHQHDEHCGHDFLGQPRNWIDAFGRNFFPSKHTHLGDGKATVAEAREILPWMKLSAELDPQRVESFTVGAYWLRQMNKNNEALQFLREGLRANPDSFEILFELGRCYDDQHESALARNLWELALRRWQDQESHREHPNHFLLAQILTHLIRLEARENHRDKAIRYLELLKKISPAPEQIQKRIEEVKAGQRFEAEPTR